MACEVEYLCCTVQYEKGFIGTIPIIHIHMYWGSQSLFPFMYWVHREELNASWGRNYDMYLGLGMRYESEIWTIVISMNRAFK